MSVSLVQVSKLAGVSKSTVSRVINHDPRVSPEAVRAVTEAIARLGYTRPAGMGRPRRHPSGLSKGSIALLFPDTNPGALKTVLSGRLMHGIEEALTRRGLSLVVAGLPESDRLPQAITQRLVDGVLVRGTAPESSRKALVEGLGRLPVVMVFAPRGEVPAHWDFVLEDNEAIAAQAFTYLSGRGRRRLAFLNYSPEHPSFRVRGRSFIERAAEAGLSVSTAGSATDPVDHLLRQLFDAEGGPPDGLFVPGGDDQVVACYRGLVSLGLKVGMDIDLISCNNDPVRLSTLDPQLANIDIHAEAIGRAAAETLLWRLQNPRDPQRRLTVAPRLVEPERPEL